jgi:hypothetical protein
MGLFKPKAPKAPEGATYNFRFASDGRNPDGGYRQQAGTPQLPDALAVVVAEIGRLRAAIDEGKHKMDAPTLNRAISLAMSENADYVNDWELAKRQFVGGVASKNEVASAQAKYHAGHSALRALQDDLRKREAADVAQQQLNVLTSALR